MTEWAMRRFWTAASVEPREGAFAVLLDGRPVRTPGKRLLAVPSRDMARAIAAEWDAQEATVDPGGMPWTRSANSALDKVAVQRAAVEDHLIAYAGTDLLSYRAEAPEQLLARQCAAWDPVLDWLTRRFDVRLAVTRGLMPVAQSDEALARLKGAMAPMSDFAITGFHDLVTLSGSYTLALAVTEGECTPESAWSLSRIDEDWQAEQWGVDEEAAEAAEIKRAAFLHAAAFFHDA